MKVFLDSSFLIAYAIKTDDNNEKAVKLSENGIFDNECYVSNLIINEIVTVSGMKGNIEKAINIYDTLKDECTIINEYENKTFNDNVLTHYKDYNTKLSFTDCAIIEIMREHNITELVSFDKGFDKSKNINRIH